MKGVPVMASFVGVMLVALLGLVVWLASRASKLEEHVQILEGEIRSVKRRLILLEPMRVPEVELQEEQEATSAVPFPPRRASAPSRPPVPDLQALDTPILDEVIPNLGIATLMAEDLAA